MATCLLGLTLLCTGPAQACQFENCPEVGLGDGDATIGQTDSRVAGLAGGEPDSTVNYLWRLRTLCMLSDEATGACSPMDFRDCPQVPGRVIGFYVIQRRAVVRPDGNIVGAKGELVPAPDGFGPGDTVGSWTSVNGEGSCLDITPLNPPPSPAEVFTYFERLPLPTLTVQHQPPGDGLSGLPVIFYTDSPTTQTFTVDIRGFTVVINAAAESYTWHTGDPATPTLVSTDPGQRYPDHSIEHDYRSGNYTAYLTVTWGATFTVNGSAPTEVDGTTTTDGPPVTFDVLKARAVLTNPYD